MTYRLHGFAQSGNSYKVALYLALAGLPWEAAPIDFGRGQTRDPAWREGVNEMGEAPVLETPDGQRMSQSGAILTWLSEETGQFAPRNDAVRLEALRWVLFDNHKFTSFNATHRFMRCFLPTEPDPAVMAWLKGRIDAAFAIVDKHMQGRRFIADDQPTIADISMVGYLYFPTDELGFDIAATYPAIHAWTERVKALPGWVGPYELLPKADMPRRGA